jgi:hypothetical protein
MEPKSRARTVKKVDALARAYLDEQKNTFVGGAFLPGGHFLCLQEDKASYYPEIQTSTALSGISITADDFDFASCRYGVLTFCHFVSTALLI